MYCCDFCNDNHTVYKATALILQKVCSIIQNACQHMTFADCFIQPLGGAGPMA
jgi:hypothetical protein